MFTVSLNVVIVAITTVFVLFGGCPNVTAFPQTQQPSQPKRQHQRHGQHAFIKGSTSFGDVQQLRTVSSVLSSPTALHAVAKKKKSTTTTAAAAVSKKKKAASSAAASTTPVEVVNRAELVAQTADKCGLSKKDTEAAMTAFLQVIQENIADVKKVTLVGFGSFSPKYRAARKGRNPQTGEELDIAASKSVGFSVGKSFKDKLNE
jgi:DNA-binding protein HU-beta